MDHSPPASPVARLPCRSEIIHAFSYPLIFVITIISCLVVGKKMLCFVPLLVDRTFVLFVSL